MKKSFLLIGFLAFCLLFFFNFKSNAQFWGDEKLPPVSHNLVNGMFTDNSNAIIIDNYMYYTDYYGLLIYDIIDPVNPVQVSKTPLPGSSAYFAIHNSYAFVLVDAGYMIVNISDINAPEPVTLVSMDVWPQRLAISNNVLYIAHEEGIISYSISDPEMPEGLDDLYITPSNVGFAGVAVNENIVYYVNQRFLYTVDASNPGNLSIIDNQEFTETGSCWGNLEIANGHLFVVTTLSINIFDLSNPSLPELVYGALPTPYTLYDLAIEGKLLITSHRSNGKWSILDISDPSSPEVIYTQTETSFHSAFTIGTVKNNLLIILDHARLNLSATTVHFIDISDPTVPAELSLIESVPGNSRALTVIEKDENKYALVVQDNTTDIGQETHGFLRILNVTNPQGPELISTLELPKGPVSVAPGENNYVFVSTYDYFFPYYRQFLTLINIEDVLNPYIMDEKLVYSQSISYMQWGNLSYYNGTLYMASQSYIKLFKVSSGLLDEIGSSQIYGLHGFGIYANNSSYLYIAGGNTGFQIYNLSNPNHPIMQSFYDTPGLCYDVYENEGVAYCADYDCGLAIFDVSENLANHLAQFQTQGEAINVIVVENVAYVGLLNGQIEMIDVSDPANPTSLGWYLTNGGNATDIQYDQQDNLFYAANNLEMVIFNSDFTTSIVDFVPSSLNAQVYPNPVNDLLTARFDLSQNGTALITLMDANGRLLKTIINGEYSRGEHTVYMNTESLPSGFYFLEIVTDKNREMLKFVK